MYPIIFFIVVQLAPTIASLRQTPVLVFSALVTVVLTSSFFFNFSHISHNKLGDISGPIKFISSSGVLLIYTLFALSLSSYLRRITMHDILSFVESVVLPLSSFLVFVWAVEVLSWFFDPLRSSLEFVKQLISNGPYYSRFRLSGVSFEPSFNALIMTGLLPLLVLGWSLSGARPPRRRRYFFLATAMLVFGAFSDSRTGYIVLLCEFAALLTYAALRHSRLAVSLLTRTALPFAVLVAAPLTLFAVASQLETLNLSSVSDITRLSSVNAALGVFLDHPIFGVGMGQYGFSYRSEMTAISMESWEVRDYVIGGRWDVFPPSYSLYGRVLAETGLVGFLAFYGVLWWLFRRTSFVLPLDRNARYQDFTVLVAIALGGAVLVGTSFDSFRAPFLWIYGAAAFSLPAIIKRSGTLLRST